MPRVWTPKGWIYDKKFQPVLRKFRKRAKDEERQRVIELLEEEIEEVKERLEDKKYDKTYLVGRHDGFQDLKQKLEEGESDA